MQRRDPVIGSCFPKKHGEEQRATVAFSPAQVLGRCSANPRTADTVYVPRSRAVESRQSNHCSPHSVAFGTQKKSQGKGGARRQHTIVSMPSFRMMITMIYYITFIDEPIFSLLACDYDGQSTTAATPTRSEHQLYHQRHVRDLPQSTK